MSAPDQNHRPSVQSLTMMRITMLVIAVSMLAGFEFAVTRGTRASRPQVKHQGATAPVTPAAGCTGANFSQPSGSPLAAGAQPRAVVSADFNGDGKPDLVVGDEGSKDLTVYLGNGAGGFAKSTVVLATGPVALAVGDFNLDGKMDLIAANGTANALLLLGDGAGNFTPSNIAVNGGNGTIGIAAADFNIDGKPDFAVTNYNSGTVSIMLGNGNGTFSAAPVPPLPTGTNPGSVVAADFNRDGKLDIAVANIKSNDVVVYLGDGHGGFNNAPQLSVPTLGNGSDRITAADVNSDGKLDLLTANSNSSNVSILIGKGDGSFQSAANSPLAVLANTDSLSIADLNLDGKPDLLVSLSGSNRVQLFVGDGAGGFSQASGSPISTGPFPFWTAVADFNLDGRPDFAVANQGPGTVSVELNTCNAQPCAGISFTPAVGSPFPAQDRVAAAADFNLDGKLDLAVVSTGGSNSLSILLGDGTGGFVAAPNSPMNIGLSSLSVVSADFNLDGKPDLAIARSGSAGIAIMFGAGNGTFAAPKTTGGSATLFPQQIVVGDFNRDGQADLAVALANGGVIVLLGDFGDLPFPAPGSPFATLPAVSLAAADFNGDGKLDVAVANYHDNKFTIMLGDGTGALAPAPGSPFAVGNDPESIVAADFNHDGKPDIATANTVGGGNVSVLLGNGSGGFTQVTGSPFAAGTNSFKMDVGDFNLDGNADLVVTNTVSNNVTMLIGNGSGGFSQPPGSPIVGAHTSETVTVADFNLDGRPDFAVVNSDVGGVTIDLNGCSAAATPTPTPTPTPNQVQFSAPTASVAEACTTVAITVTRSGDTSGAASVDYATADGTATERGDYITARGTLNFAAGDSAKTITLLINDDSFVEGPETFNVNLSNAIGFNLGTTASAVVTIVDNPSEPNPNVIDDAQTFVCQHYHDFLGRHPDQNGWDFWTSQITNCGTDAACIQTKRVNVSQAFFLSIEFQKTGFLVERIYKVAFSDGSGGSTLGGNHQLSVPFVRYNEFMADSQRIARSVIIGQLGADQLLEANTQAFTNEFVQRTSFTTAFPALMTPAQFVDQLNANAGNPLSQSERNQLVADLSANIKTRAQVLRAVAEDPDLVNGEFNRAFVLAEYFGYLRRNPNDPQDVDYSGFDFWLNKLNQFNGNYSGAEMTKAFIISPEYRHRFGS